MCFVPDRSSGPRPHPSSAAVHSYLITVTNQRKHHERIAPGPHIPGIGTLRGR